MSPSPKNHISRYEFMGDTTFNEIDYAKVYITMTAGFYRNKPCEYWYYQEPIEEMTYFGAVRHDSLNRVYYVPLGSDKEHKIYDFSANLNDTVKIDGFNGSYPSIVLEIDSVIIPRFSCH